MTRLSENSVLNIKNKSFSVTAEVVGHDGPLNGTILAQGGAIGGWSLYTTDGHAKFAYNLLGIQTFTTEASQPVPAGTHQVRIEFAYDGGGYAKGGAVTLYYDGEKVGEGRVGATQPFVFSADEGADVGCETGTTVAADLDVEASAFTGQINWVELKTGEDDHTHLLDPEDHIHVLMARHSPRRRRPRLSRTPQWGLVELVEDAEMVGGEPNLLCRNLRTSMLDRIGIARCSALRST